MINTNNNNYHTNRNNRNSTSLGITASSLIIVAVAVLLVMSTTAADAAGTKTKTLTISITATLQSLTRTISATRSLQSLTGTHTRSLQSLTASHSNSLQSLTKTASATKSGSLQSLTRTITGTLTSSLQSLTPTRTQSLQSLTQTATASKTTSLQSLTRTLSSTISGSLQSLTHTITATKSSSLQSLTKTTTKSASLQSVTKTSSRSMSLQSFTKTGTRSASLQSLTRTLSLQSPTKSRSPQSLTRTLSFTKSASLQSLTRTLSLQSLTQTITGTKSGSLQSLTSTRSLQSLTKTSSGSKTASLQSLTRTASLQSLTKTLTKTSSASLQSLTHTSSSTKTGSLQSHTRTQSLQSLTHTLSSTKSGTLRSLTTTVTGSITASLQSLTRTSSSSTSHSLQSHTRTYSLQSLTKSRSLQSLTNTITTSATASLQSLTRTASPSKSHSLQSHTRTQSLQSLTRTRSLQSLTNTITRSATASLQSLTRTLSSTNSGSLQSHTPTHSLQSLTRSFSITKTGTLQSLTATRSLQSLTHTLSTTRSGTLLSLTSTITGSKTASLQSLTRTSSSSKSHSLQSHTRTHSLQSLTRTRSLQSLTNTITKSATASLQSLTQTLSSTKTGSLQSLTHTRSLQSLTNSMSLTKSGTLRSLTSTLTGSKSASLQSLTRTLSLSQSRSLQSLTRTRSLQSLTRTSSMTKSATLQSLTHTTTSTRSASLQSLTHTLSTTMTGSLQSLTQTITGTKSLSLQSLTLTHTLQSLTRTISNSKTGTMTKPLTGSLSTSVTETSSTSNTATDALTGSKTNSITATRTSTPSSSDSETDQPTSSKTGSSTKTGTFSRTSTASSTLPPTTSHSESSSATEPPTPSKTNTASKIPTTTKTDSLSSSLTSTNTAPLTPTKTKPPTPSKTASNTKIPTPSKSVSETDSRSSSFATKSFSASQLPTESKSMSVPPTLTKTQLPPTSSKTHSKSSSKSKSQSANTRSHSISWTEEETTSHSRSQSRSPTKSKSVIPPPTPTASKTHSKTASRTASRTVSPGPTPTKVPTRTLSSTSFLCGDSAPARCWDGTCALSEASCTCLPGLERCQSNSACVSDVSNRTLCPCPTGTTLCSADNSCAVSCATTCTSTQVRCTDGTCQNRQSACTCPNSQWQLATISLSILTSSLTEVDVTKKLVVGSTTSALACGTQRTFTGATSWSVADVTGGPPTSFERSNTGSLTLDATNLIVGHEYVVTAISTLTFPVIASGAAAPRGTTTWRFSAVEPGLSVSLIGGDQIEVAAGKEISLLAQVSRGSITHTTFSGILWSCECLAENCTSCPSVLTSAFSSATLSSSKSFKITGTDATAVGSFNVFATVGGVKSQAQRLVILAPPADVQQDPPVVRILTLPTPAQLRSASFVSLFARSDQNGQNTFSWQIDGVTQAGETKTVFKFDPSTLTSQMNHTITVTATRNGLSASASITFFKPSTISGTCTVTSADTPIVGLQSRVTVSSSWMNTATSPSLLEYSFSTETTTTTGTAGGQAQQRLPIFPYSSLSPSATFSAPLNEDVAGTSATSTAPQNYNIIVDAFDRTTGIKVASASCPLQVTSPSAAWIDTEVKTDIASRIEAARASGDLMTLLEIARSLAAASSQNSDETARINLQESCLAALTQLQSQSTNTKEEREGTIGVINTVALINQYFEESQQQNSNNNSNSALAETAIINPSLQLIYNALAFASSNASSRSEFEALTAGKSALSAINKLSLKTTDNSTLDRVSTSISFIAQILAGQSQPGVPDSIESDDGGLKIHGVSLPGGDSMGGFALEFSESTFTLPQGFMTIGDESTLVGVAAAVWNSDEAKNRKGGNSRNGAPSFADFNDTSGVTLSISAIVDFTISLQGKRQTLSGLTNPIDIDFETNETDVNNETTGCYFYDQGQRAWKNDGVTTGSKTRSTRQGNSNNDGLHFRQNCKTNHLTQFAIFAGEQAAPTSQTAVPGAGGNGNGAAATDGDDNFVAIISGSVVGGVVLIALIFLLFFVSREKKKKQKHRSAEEVGDIVQVQSGMYGGGDSTDPIFVAIPGKSDTDNQHDDGPKEMETKNDKSDLAIVTTDANPENFTLDQKQPTSPNALPKRGSISTAPAAAAGGNKPNKFRSAANKMKLAAALQKAATSSGAGQAKKTTFGGTNIIEGFEDEEDFMEIAERMDEDEFWSKVEAGEVQADEGVLAVLRAEEASANADDDIELGDLIDDHNHEKREDDLAIDLDDWFATTNYLPKPSIGGTLKAHSAAKKFSGLLGKNKKPNQEEDEIRKRVGASKNEEVDERRQDLAAMFSGKHSSPNANDHNNNGPSFSPRNSSSRGNKQYQNDDDFDDL